MQTKRSSLRSSSANGTHGMNWISQHKRLAIYLRDGCACVYCGQGIEYGKKLTLDHLVPRSVFQGKQSDEHNLVTACHLCNSTRGDKFLFAFCASLGNTALALKARKHARRSLTRFLVQAKALIALRGSCARALATENLAV